jgi:riboflavin kinase/FMN adenylyltransferase
MRFMRRPSQDRDSLPGHCVATVGTFDGLHLGHQRILSRVLAAASERDLPSVVLSFEPTPREYFSAGVPPARLTRFREKFDALRNLGMHWLFCPPFDAAMQSLEPEEFIQRLLVDTLGVKHLVVGDDFVFARQRRGNLSHLRHEGERHGFSVEQVGSVLKDGKRVSSTEIRRLLAAGEMSGAKNLLGRHYAMTGRVVDGQKLGKQLGYPTANLNLNRRASPVAGIFAVRVGGLASTNEHHGLLDGVASVGTRPTIEGVEPLLEVHIFDFDRDIYGEYIQVEFVAKLRDEVKFPDLETMTEQMHIDAAQARQILKAA